MSGHSKWATIKRDKAKTDDARGKIFTKIGKEIQIACKTGGGGDPATNPRLATVIAKAKANNMPNDNIQRSIKKATGELGNVNYEEFMYEGYGPGGSAVMLDILTDNKNRAAAEIRHIFDRAGGALGGPNSVSYLFKRVGVITTKVKDGLSADDVMMVAVEANADDVEIDEDCYTFFVDPSNLNSVRESLFKQGFEIMEAEMQMVPETTMELDDTKYSAFMKMIQFFEENDDVQNVFHNVEIKDEE